MTSASTDKVQSYFLAEISMRRMLHRCNTAIRRTSEGQVVYAPGIALELESQLNEWYNYLPDLVRFQRWPTSAVDDDGVGGGGNGRQSIGARGGSVGGTPGGINHSTQPCPLRNFLRVQYLCCKISIFWPAVYQAIQNENEYRNNHPDDQLQDHCRRFFDAYIQAIPGLMAAFHECIVNRWTLFASIFMTTMAALKGAATPWMQGSFDVVQMKRCFALTATADRGVIGWSPSLVLLAETLGHRLAGVFEDG